MIKQDSDYYPRSGWRNIEGVLLAQGSYPAQEIEIIKGNADEFKVFPLTAQDSTSKFRYSTYAAFWTTGNYGERMIYKQGGTLLTSDKVIYNKQIKKFKL